MTVKEPYVDMQVSSDDAAITLTIKIRADDTRHRRIARLIMRTINSHVTLWNALTHYTSARGDQGAR